MAEGACSTPQCHHRGISTDQLLRARVPTGDHHECLAVDVEACSEVKATCNVPAAQMYLG